MTKYRTDVVLENTNIFVEQIYDRIHFNVGQRITIMLNENTTVESYAKQFMDKTIEIVEHNEYFDTRSGSLIIVSEYFVKFVEE